MAGGRLRRIHPAYATIAFSGLVFGLPLLLLVAYSFGLVQILRGDPGPSTDVWADFLTSPYLPHLRSLRVALITAVLCVMIGYPVAYYLASLPAQRAEKLLALILLPFVTSFLLRVLAWRAILTDGGVLHWGAATMGVWPVDLPMTGMLFSATAVTIILVYAWLPMAVLPIYASLMLTDARLVEAAMDQGASRMTAFFTVTLPASLPGLVAAFVLVFVPVNGEYVVPMLVGGNNGMLFGNAVANMFGAGFDWSLGAVLASFLFGAVVGLLCFVALTIAAVRWIRRSSQRAARGVHA